MFVFYGRNGNESRIPTDTMVRNEKSSNGISCEVIMKN